MSWKRVWAGRVLAVCSGLSFFYAVNIFFLIIIGQRMKDDPVQAFLRDPVELLTALVIWAGIPAVLGVLFMRLRILVLRPCSAMPEHTNAPGPA